ncbi:MAG: lyase family protein, partial [Vulcanococcus sp.]
MSTRNETDSMGAIAVPAEHYWGAQTQRSISNFPFGQRMPLAVVHAFGHLKAACAEANRDLGKLDAGLCEAIVSAAEQVASGQLDQEFPLKVWQTGSGTQSNMNANEVIA